MKDEKGKTINKCKKCTHYVVCKYRHLHSEQAKSNIMYEMNEYLEWNNVQEIFEKYVSCQYFTIEDE